VTAALLERSRHVEHCMGTVFTVDVRDAGDWAPAIDEVVRWLHLVDRTFSTYQPGSDISCIRRGELRVADADPLVSEVLELCARVHRETGGFFTPLADGGIDPTGLVKGWAIERASVLLRAAGSANHAVNGGGDMQLAGEAAPGERWGIGIADPFDRSRVLAHVHGGHLAVATSGVTERGLHIVDPFTGRPADRLASVTVVGPRLTWADTFATAAFAMGRSARAWVETVEGFDALIVAADGTIEVTSRWACPQSARFHPGGRLKPRPGAVEPGSAAGNRRWQGTR
jgi:FAD:protein FMN transferase